MDRVTFRIQRDSRKELEQLVELGEYASRSEALRAAVREMLDDKSSEDIADRRDQWSRQATQYRSDGGSER